MKQITSGRSRTDCSPYFTRVYRNHADRKRALTQLRRQYNYFICYLDTQGVALAVGVCSWQPKGEYINW